MRSSGGFIGIATPRSRSPPSIRGQASGSLKEPFLLSFHSSVFCQCVFQGVDLKVKLKPTFKP